MKLRNFTFFVIFATTFSFLFGLTEAVGTDLSFASKRIETSPDIVNKLAVTVRVITAITLQNGLSNGKIPVDSVISELLNIGPGELKNVESFENENLNKFLTGLNSVQLPDASVGGIDNVEAILVDIHELKELWKIVGTSINMPDSAAYKKLDAIKNLNVAIIEKLKFNTTNDFLNQASLTDADVTKLKSSLSSVATEIQSLKGNVDIEGSIKVLKQLKPLSSLARIHTIYLNKVHLNPDQIDDPIKNSLAGEFLMLQSLTESAAKFSSMESTMKLISSRLVHHPADKVYSSGFVNGYKDMSMLSSDIKNKWVSNITGNSNTKDFHKLQTLAPGLNNLDDEWNRIFTFETYDSVQNVATLQKLLLSIKQVPSWDDVERFMQEAKTRAKSVTQKGFSISFMELSEKTGMLLRKLSSLQKSLQIAQQINSEVIPNLPSSISLKDISKMKKLVTMLENNIAIILDGVSITKIDMDTQNSAMITDFKTNQVDNIKTFNCIKDIAFWFDEVTFSAQSIIKLRDIKKKSQVLKSVKTAFSAILGSLKSLTQIRSSFESLKVGSINDNKELTTLNEVSKPFGEAVTALVVGNNLLSKKSEFEFFIKTGYTIHSKIASNKALEVRSLFVKHWGDFDETTQNIRSLLNGLSDLMEKFQVSGNLTLEDVGRLFNNLPILVDVDLMFNERLAAIELLKSNKPTPEETKLSDDFKKSLLELSKLDLKFSRFQKSLNSMSDTINKLVGMMSGNSSQVTATTTGGAAVESVSSWSDPEYIVCYAVLVVVAFIAFIVFWCCSPIKTIDYDALNTLEMENGLKKDEKEEEKVKKGKCKVFVGGKQYKVFQKRMKEATDKQKQKLAGHSASGSSSATNTRESATPSGSTTNTRNTVTLSGSSGNVAGGSANPSGSGINNAASAVSKIDEVPIKAAENEKKKDADKDGKTGETDKAAATTTGDTNKAGGSVIPNKTGNNANKTCGNKTGVTEKPANDGKNLDDIFTFYGFVKPKSFPSSLKEQLWIEKTLFDIQQKIKEQREANRDPSTQSSSSSFHKGWTQEEAELNELSKQLKIRYKGLTGKNLQEGIPEEEHVGRNEAKTVDDDNYSFKQDIKK